MIRLYFLSREEHFYITLLKKNKTISINTESYFSLTVRGLLLRVQETSWQSRS